jgi:hypothetical protein
MKRSVESSYEMLRKDEAVWQVVEVSFSPWDGTGKLRHRSFAKARLLP